MQAKWGKPVVMKTAPAPPMRLGAESVQKSPTDGYTLLVAHDGTMAINPLVFSDLAYDPQKDFVPLGLVISIPEAVMVNIAVPVRIGRRTDRARQERAGPAHPCDRRLGDAARARTVQGDGRASTSAASPIAAARRP